MTKKLCQENYWEKEGIKNLQVADFIRGHKDSFYFNGCPSYLPNEHNLAILKKIASDLINLERVKK